MLLQSQARVIALGILLSSSLLVTHGYSQGKFGGMGLPTVGPSLSYEVSYEVEKGASVGRMSVTAKVAPNFHTYSITQPDGGPTRTSVEVESEYGKVSGAFVPDREPHLGQDEAWPGVRIEEYDKFVTWTAPLQFSKEFEPGKTELIVSVDGLVCGSGSCTPVGGKLTAKFAGYYQVTPKVELLRVGDSHAQWSARLRPSKVKAGATAILELSAELDEGYHVYRHIPKDAETQFRTLIVAKTKSGLKFGAANTDAPLESFVGLDVPVEYYAEHVNWQIPIRVPETARPGELPIEILVGFLTCDENSCDPPAGLSVSGNLTVATESSTEALAFSLSEVNYGIVADAPNLTTWIDAEGDAEQLIASPPKGSVDKQEPAQSLTLVHVLAALAGGFILNFMPCVLPVIGLKVMSFVNQAGNKHSQVVKLNLAFVGGILGVMLVLALATVVAKVVWGSAFGWGEQFTVLEFKVALAALVFAMALSFLGVWEIPIPGFAMSSKSGELMQKEGPWGAFLKGVLTTVLATPCSGPLLGSLFGLSLSLSSLNVVFLYLLVGLGMSLPYLALCFYPGFIKLLPRPGAWMETLKQVLAFPLLLTVVFFVASIDDGHRIATLILLIVVWFVCWLVGRVPAYSDRGRIWTAWLTGAATIALGAFISFSYFGPLHSDLPWVPYNEAHLAKHRQEGKTVMIDFTANWCMNCQLNTRFAIERKKVADLIAQNQVVPMLADWTEPSDEIREKLDDLNSNSIPLLVIYPANPNAAPILLRDLLTESKVLEALKQAGPSLPKSKLTSTTLP